MLRRALLLGLCAAALSLSNAFGQDAKAPAPAAPEKGKYQNAEVAPFTAQDGVQVTAAQLKELTDATVKELQDIKKFKQVSLQGATSDAQAQTLKVSAVVTKFKAGSRTKRYMIGFGAGKSKVIAHVRFLDGETGAVLYEFDADGDVVMGLFGGNSGGAKSELAGQVAKAAKKKFF
ncbi:MAG: DUF4410 domain-containing protein [Acidobacteria bacterium]|nr:DUF4410 domain-containing protein [Acidobacteriota bacterium]